MPVTTGAATIIVQLVTGVGVDAVWRYDTPIIVDEVTVIILKCDTISMLGVSDICNLVNYYLRIKNLYHRESTFLAAITAGQQGYLDNFSITGI